MHTADFHEFEDGGAKTMREDVRVFGTTPEQDLPISRNLEPEDITVAGEAPPELTSRRPPTSAPEALLRGGAASQSIWPMGSRFSAWNWSSARPRAQ
ncbi:hypothetical protein [Brevibacterium limosum]|uniref:hypothetical protein n=1 Tax=Brevibacterium limosum TaxID=2697565 RepID=UPI001AA14C2A|nr:hypothetical protein [Brevibacterium limosum]